MSFNVKFRAEALREWKKLDKPLQQKLAKILKKCSENPHIISLRLRGTSDHYKIRLRAAGCRLIYQVMNDTLIVSLISLGDREHNDVYNLFSKRLR